MPSFIYIYLHSRRRPHCLQPWSSKELVQVFVTCQTCALCPSASIFLTWILNFLFYKKIISIWLHALKNNNTSCSTLDMWEKNSYLIFHNIYHHTILKINCYVPVESIWSRNLVLNPLFGCLVELSDENMMASLSLDLCIYGDCSSCVSYMCLESLKTPPPPHPRTYHFLI